MALGAVGGPSWLAGPALATENSHSVCFSGTWASRACGCPAWGLVSVEAPWSSAPQGSRGCGRAGQELKGAPPWGRRGSSAQNQDVYLSICLLPW